MTTFALPTQIAGSNAKRVTIGAACKTAVAVAVVGMISLFSVAQMSSAPFASHCIGVAPQSARDPRTWINRHAVSFANAYETFSRRAERVTVGALTLHGRAGQLPFK